MWTFLVEYSKSLGPFRDILWPFLVENITLIDPFFSIMWILLVENSASVGPFYEHDVELSGGKNLVRCEWKSSMLDLHDGLVK